MTFALKQTILEDFQKSMLSSAEIALIKEETFDLDDKGQPKSRPLFLQLPKNVRFMFSLIIRFREIPLDLKVGGRGWQSFLAAIEVRNRLMHPKSESDLNVSDDELNSVQIAYRWYFAHVNLALSHHLDLLYQILHDLPEWIGKDNSEKVEEVRSKIAEFMSKSPVSTEELRRIQSFYAKAVSDL